MKWIEAKVIFDHQDDVLATDLIADVFYDFGLQGVVVDDPKIEPVEDWAEDAIGRPEHHAITGYIHQDGQAETRCKILELKLGQLKLSHNLNYRLTYKEIDEQDWAHAWKAYFWPQKITPNIVVKPTWRDYQANGDEIIIELDPGMAFGTGTHPTTGLCLALIEKYLPRNGTFLDVGAGSGILMIAADKLGAESLCGIDKDELAVNIAAENLKLNKVDPAKYCLKSGNLIDEINESYDFIAANIFSHAIIELLKDIKKVLTIGGIFVCSGIIDENKSSVISAMVEAGFDIFETATKEEWVAIVGKLQA
jgi:ribosomal protein L11 methyltransferase